MNNTQFSRLRRECFLHPHKQHPWNRRPQGQKDTLKPQQKYLSLAGGSPANFHGTFQLPSLLLDKGVCSVLFPCSWQVKRRMHKHQAAPPMSGHKSTRQCSETHWASRMQSLLTQNHRVGNGLATCPREIECLSARISSVTTTSYICQTLQVPRNTGTMCCTPCAAEPTRSASARCC